jgi:hypothetical protein
MEQDTPIAAPIAPPVPVAAPAPVQIDVPTVFPPIFVVHTVHLGREGYALYTCDEGPLDMIGRRVYIVRPTNHGSVFYTVRDDEVENTYHTAVLKKRQGTVNHYITWKNERKCLTRANLKYPVLRIAPMSSLPRVNINSFIPIVQPQQPAQVQATPVVPVVPEAPKIYTIATIPQHAVRAMLRDAAMHEEICSITGEEIDVTNGAVTSCFHLFEKNAIATWLAMPNSRDKCPVCNYKCNSFTLS